MPSIVAVVCALYDYEGQPGELSFREAQRLYILDQESDPDWWLATLDPNVVSMDNGGTDTTNTAVVGKIPSNYVQPAGPVRQLPMRSLYSYQAQAEHELSFGSNQDLFVYFSDPDSPDWILASRPGTSEFGLVPAKYFQVESTVAQLEGKQQVEGSPLVDPQATSFSRKEQALYASLEALEEPGEYVDPLAAYAQEQRQQVQEVDADFVADFDTAISPTHQISPAAPASTKFYAVTAIVKILKKQRNRSGLLAVDSGRILFVNDKDKSTIQEWSVQEVTSAKREKKHLLLDIGPTAYNFQFAKKKEVEEVIKSIDAAKKQSPLNAFAVAPQSATVVNPIQVVPLPVETLPSSRSIASASKPAPSVDLPYPKAVALFAYKANDPAEVSIQEGDLLLILDESDPDWTLVELATNSDIRGLVPASYIEKRDTFPIPTSSTVPQLPVRLVVSPEVTSSQPPALPVRNAEPSPLPLSPPTLPSRTFQSPPVAPPRNLEMEQQEETPPPFLPPRDMKLERQGKVESSANPVPVSAVEPTLPPRNVPLETSKTAFAPVEEPVLPPRTFSAKNPVSEETPRSALAPKLPSPPVQPSNKLSKVDAVELPPKATVVASAPPFTAERISPVTKPSLSPTSAGEKQPSPTDNAPLVASRKLARDKDTVVSPSAPLKKPDPKYLRMWTDKSGTFKVEAKFVALKDGKVQLHKENGVKIAVPLEKLSKGDAETAQRLAAGKPLLDSKSSSPAIVEPVPLVSPRPKVSLETSNIPLYAYNGFDWLDYFVGCSISTEDAKKYAPKFVQEKMDSSTLPHLDRDLLKEMGIPGGDVIRIMAKLGKTAASSADTPSSIHPSEIPFFESSGKAVTLPRPARPPSFAEESRALTLQRAGSGSMESSRRDSSKINELEQQTQMLNLAKLDHLLARKLQSEENLSGQFGTLPPTLPPTPTSTSTSQQQLDKDAQFAAELQERELRAAGRWKETDRDRAEMKRLQDAMRDSSSVLPWPSTVTEPSQQQQQQQHTKIFEPQPVSRRPSALPQQQHQQQTMAVIKPAATVDASMIFNNAKAAGAVKQQQIPQISKTEKPMGLPTPLVPVPSAIVPMNVTVSNGDPPPRVQSNAFGFPVQQPQQQRPISTGPQAMVPFLNSHAMVQQPMGMMQHGQPQTSMQPFTIAGSGTFPNGMNLPPPPPTFPSHSMLQPSMSTGSLGNMTFSNPNIANLPQPPPLVNNMHGNGMNGIDRYSAFKDLQAPNTSMEMAPQPQLQPHQPLGQPIPGMQPLPMFPDMSAGGFMNPIQPPMLNQGIPPFPLPQHQQQQQFPQQQPPTQGWNQQQMYR